VPQQLQMKWLWGTVTPSKRSCPPTTPTLWTRPCFWKKAKELNLDAIHDTVHEMARDEARHGKAFKGLLERYFG